MRISDWSSDVCSSDLSDSVITDVAADLVGPDVKFHSCKLNFKWSKGGEEVKWHQDIQYWPHTNYSPLTIGIYLDDVGPDQGPPAIHPGSHTGPPSELHHEDRGGARRSFVLGKRVYCRGDMG